MKVSSLSKFVGAGVIAVSLAVAPMTLPAHAQTSAPGANTQQNGTAPTSGPIAKNTERQRNHWGWLGLLGLTGLLGFLKNTREEVRHVSNDPNVEVRSNTEYR